MQLKDFAAISAIVISVVVIVSAVLIIISRQDPLKFIQARFPPLPTSLNGVTLNHDNSLMFATNSRPDVSLMIITITNNGSFLGGATYSIIPLSGSSYYTVKDDGPRDTNKATPGIITIAGLQNGNYTVTEVNSSQGYSIDKASKIIEIKTGQSVPIATFTNIPLKEIQQNNNNNSQIKSITYTVKFECGSIIGDEGPLRPGHYDTDISIFNRQEYPVKILLNAMVNNGKNTNAIVKTLQPQTSTAIICKDLRQLFNIGNSSKEIVEGFVVIGVIFNGGTLGSLYDNGGSTIISPPISKDEINFLDVHVFYTANALETLPHEILVDKITFSILNDTSKKIPSSLLTKTLNINLQSQMNQVSDPEFKVKSILAKSYNLSDHELGALKIKIINVSIGVGTMIDDHAISSSTVQPQSGT